MNTDRLQQEKNQSSQEVFVGRHKVEEDEEPHRLKPDLTGVSKAIGPDGIADVETYKEHEAMEKIKSKAANKILENMRAIKRKHDLQFQNS